MCLGWMKDASVVGVLMNVVGLGLKNGGRWRYMPLQQSLISKIQYSLMYYYDTKAVNRNPAIRSVGQNPKKKTKKS